MGDFNAGQGKARRRESLNSVISAHRCLTWMRHLLLLSALLWPTLAYLWGLPSRYYMEGKQAGGGEFKYALDTTNGFLQYYEAGDRHVTDNCTEDASLRYFESNNTCVMVNSDCAPTVSKIFEFLSLSVYKAPCKPSNPPSGYEELTWGWFSYSAGSVTVAYCGDTTNMTAPAGSNEMPVPYSVVALVTASQGTESDEVEITAFKAGDEVTDDVFQNARGCPRVIGGGGAPSPAPSLFSPPPIFREE